jgi:chemotaxis protein CheX
LGLEVESIDEDVIDALGELANMVAGSIKPLMAKDGVDVELSLPSVIYGSEYSMTTLADSEILAVPFELDSGIFIVELAFKNYSN